MIKLSKLGTYDGIATCDVSGNGEYIAVVSNIGKQTCITIMYKNGTVLTTTRVSGFGDRRDIALNYTGDTLILGDSAVDRVLVLRHGSGRLEVVSSINPREGALFNVSGFGNCVCVSPDSNIVTVASSDSTFYKYKRNVSGKYIPTLSVYTGDLANIRNRWSLANYNSDIADDCMHRAYGAKYNHTHMVSLADNPKRILSVTDNYITYESIDDDGGLTTVESMVTPTCTGTSQYDIGLAQDGSGLSRGDVVGIVMVTNTNMGIVTSTLYRVNVEV